MWIEDGSGHDAGKSRWFQGSLEKKCGAIIEIAPFRSHSTNLSHKYEISIWKYGANAQQCEMYCIVIDVCYEFLIVMLKSEPPWW